MKKSLVALTVLLTICASSAYADFETSVGIGFQAPQPHNQGYKRHHHRDYSGWVAAGNGYIPKNAVMGGYQSNGPLYICHTNYNGSMQPGKMLAGKCNISYSGQEIAVPNFEVLVGHSYQWVNLNNGFPANAVVGGYQQDPSYTGPLYVCHGAYGDGVHPGKLIAGKCNIGYGGQEIALDNYQVLTQS